MLCLVRHLCSTLCNLMASLVAQAVKNPPEIQETYVRSPGREDPLEEGTATHSRILVWRIPSVLCCAESLRRVWLFETPWTVARQAPLSMGFSRQESWSGLPGPPPGDLPNPGSNPGLLNCRLILYQLNYQGSNYKTNKKTPEFSMMTIRPQSL